MFPRRPRLRVAGVSLVVLLLLPGGATAFARDRISTVAVFPVENLTGSSIPADSIRQFLIERLTTDRINVLGSEALDDFMTRHRVRYTAGIDAATAESMRQEVGVDGVVIASVELSSGAVPPKVAIVLRLVSIQASPVVVWADDAGVAGDDAPGLLELGVVDDYRTLQTRVLNRMTQALVAYLKTEDVKTDLRHASKFRPKSSYRHITVEPGKTYSVAVLPLFNLSERRNAGEILALLFMRHLSGFRQFRVIDTGVARRQLLDARIIMEGGLSLSDAELVATLIEADFILAGRVLHYQDYEGPAGTTRVEFSTVLIEKKSRRVVWSSNSYNDGDDGVSFFERGTSRTAHVMATQMVRLATEMIAGSNH